MPIPSCGQCKHVIYNPYTAPMCGRIIMRPGNSYVPCYYARNTPSLCGYSGRLFEPHDLIIIDKPDEFKPKDQE